MTPDRAALLAPIVGVVLGFSIIWLMAKWRRKRTFKKKDVKKHLLDMDLTSLSGTEEERLRKMARRYRIDFDDLQNRQGLNKAIDKLRASDREGKRQRALADERAEKARQKQIEQEAIDSILRDMRSDT